MTISAASASRCSSALASQIGDVDVAVRVASPTTTTLHAGHDRARRIGAVRRRGNQHDVALRARRAIAVIGADHHQAGELALRAGVRLQRHRGEAGDLAERRLELAEDLLVALRPARPARTDACARTPAR